MPVRIIRYLRITFLSCQNSMKGVTTPLSTSFKSSPPLTFSCRKPRTRSTTAVSPARPISSHQIQTYVVLTQMRIQRLQFITQISESRPWMIFPLRRLPCDHRC